MSKKAIINILKFIIPVGLAIWLMTSLWAYMGEEINETTGRTLQEDLIQGFKKANYFWIAISIVCAVFSHLSRAARWNLMLNSMGYKPKLKSSFFAVMGGYLINMVIPRGGEAARAGVMTQYEKVPFKHSFGTILAERALDFVILMSITAMAFFVNFDLLQSELLEPVLGKLDVTKLLILAGIGVVGLIGLYIIIKKTKFGEKIKGFLMGLWDGLKSIFKLEKKWLFLGHTVFIWLMYGVMFYVCFLSIEETSVVSGSSVLTGFVLGSFAILVIPGGIVAYPLAIQAALASELGDNKVVGQSLGWIIWAGQTVLNIVVGGLSLILVKENPDAKYDDIDEPSEETTGESSHA